VREPVALSTEQAVEQPQLVTVGDSSWQRPLVVVGAAGGQLVGAIF